MDAKWVCFASVARCSALLSLTHSLQPLVFSQSKALAMVLAIVKIVKYV